MSTDVALTRSDTRALMNSVWSCSCTEAIRDIVISPQGVIAAIAGNDIHLYAGAPSFGASHTISCPALTAYHFSADGAHFLTGDGVGFVRWWEVHCGEENAATQFPFAPAQGNEDVQAISAIVCCAETDLVAVSAGNNLCIYGQGGLRLHSIGPLDSPIRSIQWKKSNELAVNIGTAVCMIEVTPEFFTLRQRYDNEIKDDVLRMLACAPNGNMMAAGCKTGLVQIWDLASESNEEISVFMKGLPGATHADGSVCCLDWNASSRFLAAAGGSDVIVWDMLDTTEKEEGKDSSIVCYGHDKSAVITSLSFQPKGTLLATGGDDGQVLVFDSGSFVSKGVLGGLVSSMIGGKLKQTDKASDITALAWHPSGFIVAGSGGGNVEAFEIGGASTETPKAPIGHHEGTFLITRVDGRRNNINKNAGWGGEPLIPPRNGEQDKMPGRRPMRSVGGSGGNRSPGRRPNVYMGNFKQVPRPSYPETATTTAGHWSSSMMRPAMIAPWPTYSQQHIPPYERRGHAVPAPPSDPPNNPPHTPESLSSEGATRGPPPTGPMPHRNDYSINRIGSSEQTPSMIQGPLQPQYHMGYLHYPTPYPMGYPQAAYYGYHVPQMTPEGMGPPTPGYGMPQMYPHPPINQPPKAPGLQHAASTKSESTAKMASPEPEEDMGSKSSEATNNGVNNSVTPTQPSDTSGVYPEPRQQPGLTLYVGNLAPAVEESLLMQIFAPFGPISNIQIIRERETQMSRGFGFVTYAHPVYAHAAMQQMDSVQFLGVFEGRKLKVSLSNRR